MENTFGHCAKCGQPCHRWQSLWRSALSGPWTHARCPAPPIPASLRAFREGQWGAPSKPVAEFWRNCDGPTSIGRYLIGDTRTGPRRVGERRQARYEWREGLLGMVGDGRGNWFMTRRARATNRRQQPGRRLGDSGWYGVSEMESKLRPHVARVTVDRRCQQRYANQGPPDRRLNAGEPHYLRAPSPADRFEPRVTAEIRRRVGLLETAADGRKMFPITGWPMRAVLWEDELLRALGVPAEEQP